MQLGKTLVGAILGGAVGIAALIAVQYFTGFDRAWLAILVAVLTGFGVRMMVSTHGHASYARGAITAILVLAAYWGGTAIYSELLTRGILTKELVSVRLEAMDDDSDGAAEAAGGAEIVAIADRDADVALFERPEGVRGPWKRELPTNSPWDYAAMVIAALVGYELGRGTSASKPAERQEPQDPEDTPAPVAT